MSDKTGGHACPTQSWEYDGQGNVLQYQEHGMTLLDHFAGLAMQGYISSIGVTATHAPTDTDIARYSYDQAEAMLAERNRRMEQ